MPNFHSLCRTWHKTQKNVKDPISSFKPEVEENSTKMIFWKLFFFFFFRIELGIQTKHSH